MAKQTDSEGNVYRTEIPILVPVRMTFRQRLRFLFGGTVGVFARVWAERRDVGRVMLGPVRVVWSPKKIEEPPTLLPRFGDLIDDE